MIAPTLQSEQQRRVWLYFVDLRIQYALAPLFLGLVMVESAMGKVLLLLGLAWIAGALYIGKEKPSDQEIDDMLALELGPLVERARQSLRPREEELQAAPLALLGPLDLNSPAYRRLFARPRTGRDGRRRSPINKAVVILPMEDRLGIYACRFDSLSGVATQVSAEELHYRDIVSVALEKAVEAPAGLPAEQDETRIFSIELKSGRRVSIPVSPGWLKSDAGEGTPLAGLDRIARSVQVLIQDKR